MNSVACFLASVTGCLHGKYKQLFKSQERELFSSSLYLLTKYYKLKYTNQKSKTHLVSWFVQMTVNDSVTFVEVNLEAVSHVVESVA